MNERSDPRIRGFATVAAVVLIGMASVAFLGMAALARHELVRTRRAAADAQLRQLLLAGQAASDARLSADAAPTPGAVVIELPAVLAEPGGRLTIHVQRGDSTDARRVEVLAAAEGWTASQSLNYTRDGARWRLAGAELSPSRYSAPPEPRR